MSYQSVLSVSNGGPWNPKLALKINSLRTKQKAQNFASWMFSEYAFKIKRKKKGFFDHSTTLKLFEILWSFHTIVLDIWTSWLKDDRRSVKTEAYHLQKAAIIELFFCKKKYLLVGAWECYGRVNGSVSEWVSEWVTVTRGNLTFFFSQRNKFNYRWRIVTTY